MSDEPQLFPQETHYLLDESLSLESKGALAYLLKVVAWREINAVEFREKNHIGRDKARRIFNELENNGYLKRERMNNEFDGTFYWNIYVTAKPTHTMDNQGMVSPEVETTLTENQGMVEPPSPSPSPLQSSSSPSSLDIKDSFVPEKEEEPIPPIVPPSLKGVDIPLELADQRFFDIWEEWVQHRKEIRHTLKPVTIPKQIKQLANWTKDAPVPAAVAAEHLDHAMTKGWTGYHKLEFTHPVWDKGWDWDAEDKKPAMSDAEYMRQFE